MMRITIAVALCAALLSGCGEKSICGKQYSGYGLFTQDEKVESIKYKVSVSSVIVAVVFSETIIVPLLIVGLDLWEPVEPAGACP